VDSDGIRWAGRFFSFGAPVEEEGGGSAIVTRSPVLAGLGDSIGVEAALLEEFADAAADGDALLDGEESLGEGSVVVFEEVGASGFVASFDSSVLAGAGVDEEEDAGVSVEVEVDAGAGVESVDVFSIVGSLSSGAFGFV